MLKNRLKKNQKMEMKIMEEYEEERLPADDFDDEYDDGFEM